jgi:O-antigen ligase
VFLLACMKLGQEAFLGKLTGSMVWENQGIMRLNGAPGTMFGHPNSLSGMAVGTLPFLYYLWPIVTRRWRMALLVLLLFAINIIVFTGSRTGYLGTAGLLLFFYARSSVKSRFVVVGLLVLLVGLPFVPEQYSERFMSSFTGQEREGASKQERLEIINDAWEVFKQNPQGVGIYAFLDARSRILGKYPMDTHNLYLQLLADLGIGGALVFGALIIALCSGLLSTERTVNAAVSAAAELAQRAKRADLQAAAASHVADLRFMGAVLSATLAYVVARLGLGFFGHDLYEVYWWLAAGILMAIANMVPVACRRTAELRAAVEGQTS